MELEKLYNILFSGDEFLTISLLVGQKIPFHKLAKYVADKIQNIQQFEIINVKEDDTNHLMTFYQFGIFVIRERLFIHNSDLKCHFFASIKYSNWGYVGLEFMAVDCKANLESQYKLLLAKMRKKSYEFILKRLIHTWIKYPFY